MGKEYKQLKDIKLQDILDLNDGPFKLECLDRLADCGFIEEEKTYYKVGQCFEHDDGEYILASLGNLQAALVNVKSGRTWAGIVPIQKATYITQMEFDRLCGSMNSDAFRLIE